jgi:hypothetical protein
MRPTKGTTLLPGQQALLASQAPPTVTLKQIEPPPPPIGMTLKAVAPPVAPVPGLQAVGARRWRPAGRFGGGWCLDIGTVLRGRRVVDG